MRNIGVKRLDIKSDEESTCYSVNWKIMQFIEKVSGIFNMRRKFGNHHDEFKYFHNCVEIVFNYMAVLALDLPFPRN